MRQTQETLSISTHGAGLYEITHPIVKWCLNSGIQVGQLTLFIRHTSASLTIQENADPSVQADLQEFFQRLVPEDEPWYRHRSEGPDDMPAHIKSALTNTSLSIPINAGRPLLGTW